MNYKTLLPLFVFVLLLAPVVTLAQFKPLVGIPGISDPNADFNTYINTIYAISISIAALVAVIKIIIAGVKWMLSDLVTSKQDAKSDIQGALIGLLIIISAVLILEVINPQLTKTSLFLSPVSTVPGNGTPPGPAPAPSPLPPIVTLQDYEITQCATGGWNGWDCSAAEAACTAKGAKVASTFMASTIKCVLGESKLVYCTLTSVGGTPDCTAVKTACESPGTAPVTKAGTYTQITNIKANCYRPF